MSKIILICVLSMLVMDSEPGWTLLKEHEDFTVFYRQKENSKLQELKIIAQTNASLKEVVAALEDINRHKEWVYSTEESYILKKRSHNDFDYYVSVDMPFPVKDRDIVIHYRREIKDNGAIHTWSTAKPGIKEDREGFVRITDFESHYYIRNIAGGKTEIEYIVSADPAGNLPAWLVNLLKAHGPTRTINTLLTQLEKGDYSNHPVAGLTN